MGNQVKSAAKFFAVFMGTLPAAALAGEVILGFGMDDVVGHRDSPATAYGVEYRSEPKWQFFGLNISVGSAIETDEDGDFWIGAGFAQSFDLTSKLRFEISLMPGFYKQAEGGTFMGHDLEFRTQIALSYDLGGDTRIGVAIEHKSNANIGSFNQGVETAFFTLGSDL